MTSDLSSPSTYGARKLVDTPILHFLDQVRRCKDKSPFHLSLVRFGFLSSRITVEIKFVHPSSGTKRARFRFFKTRNVALASCLFLDRRQRLTAGKSFIFPDNCKTELRRGATMFPARDSQRKGRDAIMNRKRPRHEDSTGQEIKGPANCSFCQQVPAALSVKTPVLFRKKRGSTLYCLTCYFTTSAVRQDPSKYASVFSQERLDEQKQPMQELFAEAYVDLQKQLQAESSLAFSKQRADPLALLHGGGPSQQRSSRANAARRPPPEKKNAGDAGDGGFLRSVPIPMRLIQTQKEQARLQKEQIQRMNQAASSQTTDVYKRRKSSTRSIWHMAMDKNKVLEAENSEKLQEYTPPCSCGSKRVQPVGNVTSRNQDLKKGETWGMKDRGEDVVARYRCEDCGKMWNEEE